MKFNLQKKSIRLVTISNIFQLEVTQKCQHYQLCALRENSCTCTIATYAVRYGSIFTHVNLWEHCMLLASVCLPACPISDE